MLTGKNSVNAPVELILDQLNEPRPLPLGRKEFEIWSDRLIKGANVSATILSQKWTLAGCIMHLGPTEDHKPDIFFIKSLRKFAANQVASTMMIEIKEASDKEKEAQGEKPKSDLHIVDNMNEKKP